MKLHITGPMYLILRTADPLGVMTIEGEHICSDFHISPLRNCAISFVETKISVFFEERNPAYTSSYKKRRRVKVNSHLWSISSVYAIGLPYYMH